SVNEKRFCEQKIIYDFELRDAKDRTGLPRQCRNCNTTRYSKDFCESCISLHLQNLFNTWTSGNEKVDGFIQRCQKLSALPGNIMEWIPFEQFTDVNYLSKGGFGSIYNATWNRGYINDYDEGKKEFIYFGAQAVVLKWLNDSNGIGDKFFTEVSQIAVYIYIHILYLYIIYILFQALNYCKIKSEMIVNCHGVTKFPDDGNYAMVI